MKRRVFYSFHYDQDYWRTNTVRNIGAVKGNEPATDNDWEEVKQGGNTAIKRWVAEQMQGRTCCVVLVGSNTASRRWVKYEIIEAWNRRMGVVGIYIHGLKDENGCPSSKGKNPFDFIPFGNRGAKLSSVVKCYGPSGGDSRERYSWIAEHLENAVEEAIRIRNAS